MMNKASLSILGAAILVCLAWTPAQAQAAESIQLAAGSTIPVMLEKGVDAKKNKVGDEVVAKTTENVKAEGRVVIPRGSQIIGHVTEAKAKTKEESESAVGIAFDHAALKDGRQIPLALEIQAIAPAEEAHTSGPSGIPSAAPLTAGGASPSQTALGPANPNGGSPGRVPSQVDGAEAPAGGLSPSGGLTPSCHGVLGIDGLALSPETPSSTQGSLIVSQRHNVHLDGRTQMMLRVKGT
jgi:hypothetical protein